jgi:hypothetical protein
MSHRRYDQAAHVKGRFFTGVEDSMMTNKIKATRMLAASALAVALLAIPSVGHAQGIVRGAQEGAYEGGRAAGPVGAAVGGAVGAGVGGAVGAVDGILGIPYGHRCRGYYNHYGHWRCYRY